MKTCKNCAFEFEGKYCPECGQKAKTKRITTKAVFEDVRRSLFHYDRGFFFTVLQLFRRPGIAIREYLDGKRVMHVKPVKFLLWSTAVNFLLFHLLGLDQEIMDSLAAYQPNPKVNMQFSRYIFDHPAIVIFIMVPGIAFCSWLYFRKNGYNYAEHFVANAYLMGEVSMFGLVLNPLNKLLPGGASLLFVKIGIQWLVWIGYMGWSYAQLFQPRKKWTAWVKAALTLLSGYVLLLLLVSLLTVLFIVLFWPWIKPFFQK